MLSYLHYSSDPLWNQLVYGTIYGDQFYQILTIIQVQP